MAVATAPAPHRPPTITHGPQPDLAPYDMIVIGLSGKDGHAALEVTLDQARAAGVADRVYTAHADLGLIEWPSAVHRGRYYPNNRELVQITATHYGIPAQRQILTRRIVTDPTGRREAHSLLGHVASRGMWPDINARCRSANCTISPAASASS